MDCNCSAQRAGTVITADGNTGIGSGSLFSTAEQTRFPIGFFGKCDYQSNSRVSGLLVSISDAFCGTLDCHTGIWSLAIRGMDLPKMPDRAAESVFVFFGAQCRFLFWWDDL